MKTFNTFTKENRTFDTVCIDEITEMVEKLSSIFNKMNESEEYFILGDIDKIDESTDDSSLTLSEIRDDMKKSFDKFNESLKSGDVETIEEDLTGVTRRFKKRVKLVGKQIHKDTHTHVKKRLNKATDKLKNAEGGFSKMNATRHLDSMSRKYDAHMKKSHTEFWHKFKNVR